MNIFEEWAQPASLEMLLLTQFSQFVHSPQFCETKFFKKTKRWKKKNHRLTHWSLLNTSRNVNQAHFGTHTSTVEYPHNNTSTSTYTSTCISNSDSFSGLWKRNSLLFCTYIFRSYRKFYQIFLGLFDAFQIYEFIYPPAAKTKTRYNASNKNT